MKSYLESLDHHDEVVEAALQYEVQKQCDYKKAFQPLFTRIGHCLHGPGYRCVWNLLWYRLAKNQRGLMEKLLEFGSEDFESIFESDFDDVLVDHGRDFQRCLELKL